MSETVNTAMPNRVSRTGLAVSSLLLAAGCMSGNTAASPPTVTAVESAGPTPAIAGNPAQLGRAVLFEGQAVEVVSQFGTPTFESYINASEPGPVLDIGAEATVDCWVQGPEAAAPSARGVWYHYTAPEAVAGMFGAANTHWNQPVPGEPDLGNAVDPRIPACPDNIPAPQ